MKNIEDTPEYKALEAQRDQLLEIVFQTGIEMSPAYIDGVAGRPTTDQERADYLMDSRVSNATSLLAYLAVEIEEMHCCMRGRLKGE